MHTIRSFLIRPEVTAILMVLIIQLPPYNHIFDRIESLYPVTLSFIEYLFYILIILVFSISIERKKVKSFLKELGFTKITFRLITTSILTIVPGIVVTQIGFYHFEADWVFAKPLSLVLLNSITFVLFYEILYRGFVLARFLKRYNTWVSISISAFIPAFFHYSNNYQHWNDITTIIIEVSFVFLSGLSLGYFFVRSNSNLWGCILLNFVFRFFKFFDMEQLIGSVKILIIAGVFLSILLSFVVIKSLYRKSNSQVSRATTNLPLKSD